MTPQEAIKMLKREYLGDSEYMELAKQMGAKALEKLIPKKPNLDTIFPSGVKWYLCPTCNHNGIEKVGAYCHRCGQALDWSDAE